ncbi:TPA: phage tail protein [Salmonella enterica]|uniref:Phage tail protein n=1 Tax=Salmonella enterica TaxID=28901 RepID=A0A748S0L4_SALER|nr:phage tail protein [Salmonella enterica]HAK2251444.1 phage tail protein [Salmonella enterica]HAK6655632.1 phage tail protein [Salmonella enterica]HAK8882231.1 phage tail protein [Salmonella enterica]
MHRIDTLTAVKDKFGPGKNGFTDGNIRTGRLATWLNSAMWDAIQEEMCAVIERAGIELNKEEHDQLYKAILLLAGGVINEVALLAKNNLSDVEDRDEAVENLGLKPTVDKAKNAVQRDGDTMTGKLTLPQTSGFGVNTDNALGGNSIVFGDNDTGIKQNGDGILDVYANGQHVFRFQDGVAMALKNIQAGNGRMFTLSSSDSSTKNVGFRSWGNPSRPVVVELDDDSGWHFYSQRNTDGSITFAVNGQMNPSNYANFDARYQTKTGGVQDVRLGSAIGIGRGGDAPSGHLLSGVDGGANVDWANARPVQVLINGVWRNVVSL